MFLLTLLACAVVAFVIGGLWYSPLLFGKRWAYEHGFTQNQTDPQSMYTAMIGSFFGYLITAGVMYKLFEFLPNAPLSQALYWGFLLWLGFSMAIGLMTTLYSKKRSFIAYFIDIGYQLVYIEAIAVIIALLK